MTRDKKWLAFQLRVEKLIERATLDKMPRDWWQDELVAVFDKYEKELGGKG